MMIQDTKGYQDPTGYAGAAIKRKVIALLDRIGEEMGYFYKPQIYVIRFNDPAKEKDFLKELKLEKYRMYWDVTPETNKVTENGTIDIYNELLTQLEHIAQEKHLTLIFPEDVMSVACDDLAVLEHALDTLAKENRLTKKNHTNGQKRS